MLVLLVPEPAIDIAALEELVVVADVVNPAPVEHENRIGRYQH